MRQKLVLEAMPCLCGTYAARRVLTWDRYFLPIHIAVCDQCGLVHSARNLRGAALTEFYRERYRDYYENIRDQRDAARMRILHQYNAQQRLEAIRAVVPHSDSVLEIGAGMGCFLDACRSTGMPNLLGFEPGAVFHRYAREVLQLDVRAEDYTQVNALPFAPQLVVLFHVFEHLEDPEGCLRWVAQHMRADGTLVIEVPDMDGDWKALGLFHFHVAHRWYFSAVTLSNLLARCGFEPYFISRSDTDGIYPGNLRIFARLGKVEGVYPLPTIPVPQQEARIRAWVRPWSLRNGLPRAAWRLWGQRWARRRGISDA